MCEVLFFDVVAAETPVAPRHTATATVSHEEDKSVDGVRYKDHAVYGKYFRMLQCGIPMGAVHHAMVKEGLDPTILDNSPDALVAEKVALKDHPVYTKYFKLLKIGTAKEQVAMRMRQDGENSLVLDMDPNTLVSKTSRINNTSTLMTPLPSGSVIKGIWTLLHI